jgi:hypothetical protein
MSKEPEVSPEFSKVYTQLMTVTPAMAGDWLMKNIINRPLREHHVNRLARQMRHDEFVLNGETIKFDSKGRLLDGQHRLSACIVADKPFQTLVAYNCPPDAFETIDRGKTRSAADALALVGEVNVNVLGSAISYLWKYEHGRITSQGAGWKSGENYPTIHETLETLRKHPNIRESVRKFSGKSGHILGAVTALSVTHYVLTNILHDGKDAEDAERFFEQLATGIDLEDTSPIYRLREKLLMNRTARFKLPTYEIVAIIFKTWNYWRTGRDVRAIYWRASGKTAEPFPIPE